MLFKKKKVVFKGFQSLCLTVNIYFTPTSTQFKDLDQSTSYSACRGRQYYTVSHGPKGTVALLPSTV